MITAPTTERANQRMVPVCTSILARHGVDLTPEQRVLDFGCGLGRHVREFRQAGYTMAIGVDQPDPIEIAALADNPADGLVVLTSPDGTFPFESESFDFCFSTSVMEHVMNYDRALAEIRRVLKPGGWSLHVFPARWRPIEPHLHVPLAGRLQHPWWFRLWAALGIRNEFELEMDARETAAVNLRFVKTASNYPTKGDIERTFRRHFEELSFVERDFVAATRKVSRASRLAAPFIDLPFAEAAYRGFHTRVVLLRRH